MKKTEFLNTKYPSCSHKFQNLNGENFTKKTGNILTDNENPFVKFDRRVPDAQCFHGNEHTTGAMGTRDGHVTEVVDCQMQVSYLLYSYPQNLYGDRLLSINEL